ncbi:Cu(I)-responsive transcriptional regulator [Serratia oryzae]|jgi:MerR family copper efflux transcriptional regulator|uniref:Cu(I)-responsive transcriptional regulator n=1 Tax=Serratia oryzae TaxID=2034155 RepID=A0A1S8CLC6_9GAMM|nr:Cu(I)-responsive transcriptional regulator [Serratia oryzae]OMQ24499.1 Cu(I)-responsive transcriptional regulator [Serratia oryzae]VXC89151.1 DNA-binding transcriptional activator of copper-responsive regulon genes [Enterobacterales bacterium 8AC]
MNIGLASKASGLSAKMIRHYEQIGIIPPALRVESGYRYYTNDEVRVLSFIKRARDLGFSLERIKALIELWQNKLRMSADVKTLAEQYMNELDRDIARLQSMRSQLAYLADNCHGDNRSNCPIIEGLAGMR